MHDQDPHEHLRWKVLEQLLTAKNKAPVAKLSILDDCKDPDYISGLKSHYFT